MKRNTSLVLQYGVNVIVLLLVIYGIDLFMVQNVFTLHGGSNPLNQGGQLPAWVTLILFLIDAIISLVIDWIIYLFIRRSFKSYLLDNEKIVTLDVLAIGIAAISLALAIVQPIGLIGYLYALLFLITSITAIPMLLINLFKILQTKNIKWYLLGISLQSIYVTLLLIMNFASSSM